MRIRFENKNTRIYRIISSILALVIVVTGLGTYISSGSIKAEAAAATQITHKSVKSKVLLQGTKTNVADDQAVYTGNMQTFKSDFYDYLTNNESARYSGQRFYDPYTNLNTAISNYVKGSATSSEVVTKTVGANEIVLYSPTSLGLTYAYVWNGSTKPAGEWPGTSMNIVTAQGGTSYYEYTIDMSKYSFNSVNVIFNNGKEGSSNIQTIEFSANKGQAYTLKPNSDKITVYYPTSAKKSYIYAWNEGNEEDYNYFGGWPGVQMTETVQKNGTEYYKATINKNANETSANVIFHDNSGNQTGDIKGLLWGYEYVFDTNANIAATAGIGKQLQSMGNKGYTTYKSRGITMPLYFGAFIEDVGLNASVYTEYLATGMGSESGLGTITSNPDKLYKNFTWVANIAPRSSQDATTSAVQGLVDHELNSNGTVQQNGTELPYFSKAFADSTNYVNYWTEIEFPFYEVQVTENGVTRVCHQFAAQDASVYLNRDNANGSTVHNGAYLQETTTHILDTNGTSAFFPFDSTTDKYSDGQLKNNYGFGTCVTITFKLNKDGKALAEDEVTPVDTMFEFKGDDDVWVFIDDHLILDLGGAHGATSGSINFATAKAVANRAISATTAQNNLYNAGLDGSKQEIDIRNLINGFTGDESSISYDTNTLHTMKVFYMERGMYESNLFIRFNFDAVTNDNTLIVEEQTDFTNVNNGLKADTIAVAEKDIFNYTLSNKGTVNGDVISSGIIYPTYASNIIRGNSAADNREKITDRAQLSVYKKEEVTSNYIFLDCSQSLSGGDCWDSHNAVLAMDMISDNGVLASAITVYFKPYDTNNHLWYFDASDYDDWIIKNLKRYDPGNSTSDATPWNTVYINPNLTINLAGIANGTANNKFTITDWGSASTSNKRANKTVVLEGNTSNYQPGTTSTTYIPVGNVAFNISDPFAENTGAVGANFVGDSVIKDYTGLTDAQGSYNLMYGQSSEFIGQFVTGSYMNVVQNNQLNTISNYGSATTPTIEGTTVTFGSSNRNVSEYYTTTVQAIDSNGQLIVDYDNSSESKMYSDYNGEFLYNNKDSAVQDINTPIKITEVFRNTVKTGDLTITKKMEFDEPTEQEFTLKLELTNLFGSDGAKVTDYSGIVTSNGTTLNKDGTFKIKANQTIKIEGIPVGTQYTVTETSTGDSFVNKGVTYANTNQTITINTDNTVTVTNERKVGNLVLNKDVKDSDGADTNVTDADKATEFNFKVTLTAPEGVDLSKYDIKVNGSKISNPYTVSVSENSPVTITGIPYGTGYVVEETNLDESNWEKVTNTNPNGTISTDSTTATIVNKKKIQLTQDAYLTIVKYIDSLYYDSNDNAHGFQDDYSIMSGNNTTLDKHGYLQYTNAEQVFTFEVKEYDGGNTLVGTYQVLLKFPANSTRWNYPQKVDGVTYNYVQSKTFKVTAGHKYEITEINTDNGLSWRYDFVKAEGNGNVSSCTASNKTVTITYNNSASNAQMANARFWDKRSSESITVESDMSSITNNIKKAA